MPRSKNNGLSEDAKTLITVLLLLFAYPAGLIMMFIWMKWPTWVKLLIAFPVTLLLIIVIFTLFSLPFLAGNYKFNQNYNKPVPLITPQPLNYDQLHKK